MKERPILFSGQMVRAILEGRKTMTRRVVKPQPDIENEPVECGLYHPLRVNKRTGMQYPADEVYGAYGDGWDAPCPYGKPGDRLWVRETHNAFTNPETGLKDVRYAATNDHEKIKYYGSWKPSIHMRREYSRITLEIVGVRVERLMDITPEDASAEGIWPKSLPSEMLLSSFVALWDSINAKRGCSWGSNPWVWVIEFKWRNEHG